MAFSEDQVTAVGLLLSPERKDSMHGHLPPSLALCVMTLTLVRCRALLIPRTSCPASTLLSVTAPC